MLEVRRDQQALRRRPGAGRRVPAGRARRDRRVPRSERRRQVDHDARHPRAAVARRRDDHLGRRAHRPPDALAHRLHAGRAWAVPEHARARARRVLRLAGRARRRRRATPQPVAGCERVGLDDRDDTKVQDLSSGNQQRVQLAVALVHDPELLVLDEPFSGLDPVAVAGLKEILADLVRADAALLFSSHQLDVVEDLTRVGGHRRPRSCRARRRRRRAAHHVRPRVLRDGHVQRTRSPNRGSLPATWWRVSAGRVRVPRRRRR